MQTPDDNTRERLLNEIVSSIASKDPPDELMQSGLKRVHAKLVRVAAGQTQDLRAGGDEVASQELMQPAIRLVPDVPTELADSVPREAYPESPGRRYVRRRLVAMLQRSPVRWSVAVAAVLLVMLGGLSFLGPLQKGRPANQQWWLGPAVTWGAQVDAALAKAAIRGVTCRERTLLVKTDGSSSMSETWNRFYVSQDSYRRDIYDGDSLREIQWYVPNQYGVVEHTSVRFDTRSYFAPRPDGGSFGVQDPVERMRFYAQLIKDAGCLLKPQTIEGKECVGFEVSASRYGSNPDSWLDRIWLDTTTKLPVRIERLGRPVTGDPTTKLTIVQDEFDYSPMLPADTFVPAVPAEFLHAHPDEIRPTN